MKRGLVFLLFSVLIFVVLIGFVNAIPIAHDLPDLPPDFQIENFVDDFKGILNRGTSAPPYNDNKPSTFTDCLANISQGQSADPYTDNSINGSGYECRIMGDLTLEKGTYLFNGIVMFAVNGVLDCNGATLLGSSDPQEPWYQLGSGIRVYGRNNTVKNCNFARWQNGILVGHWLCFDDSNYNTLLNNTVRNSDVGIRIASRDNEIMYNNIVGTRVGMGSFHPCEPKYLRNNFIHNNYIDGTINEALRINTMSNAIIFNNTLFRSQTAMGIRLSGNENTTINNNNISGHNTMGIRLSGNENTTINNNDISGNRNMAIVGEMGSNLNISYNTIMDNLGSIPGYPAILGYGSAIDSLWIHNNIIIDNPRGGIGLSYPKNTKIYENNISRNGYGIVITDWGNETIKIEIMDNNIVDNAGSGISVKSPGQVLITRNTINQNREGVYFYSGNASQNSDNYIYDNTMVDNLDFGFVTDISENFIFGPGKGVRNHVYNNTFSGSTNWCGIFLRKEIIDNEIYNNKIINNKWGICIDFNTGGNHIRGNDVIGNSFGVSYYDSSGNNVYLNNIHSNAISNINSNLPTEVSYAGIGNYWGHSLPGPCFIPGVDSNALNVVDSHAYCGGPPNNIKIKFPTFGWYLFGSNLIPLDSTIESVLRPIAGYYDLVQSFINGIGKQYKPGNPFNDLTGISPRNGYWMKVTSTPSNDLIIIGNEVNPSSCYKLSLTPTPSPTSWVGYWASGTQPIGTALSSIDGSYSLVRTYENGAWTTYDPALPQFSDLDFMVPGQGYIITITNSDDLNYLGGFCPP